MLKQEKPTQPVPRRTTFKFFLALVGGLCLGGVAGSAYVVHDLWTQLPDVEVLDHYQPPLPLRIYSNDGQLLAEYGEERRDIVPIDDVPQKLRQALLSIEDANFYEHSGVEFGGIARAALKNLLSGERAQGASTITMQVARTFFLSRTKTYGRKISEVLLAYKLEQTFSKDKLLELYMNQVYLGERAYGFSAAASVYFGKDLKDLTLAEAAMLAGLPKAPSIYNPVANLERATVRQQYILQRMLALGHIDKEQYRQAAAERVQVHAQSPAVQPYAAYATELARQLVVEHYGPEAYSMGLDVVTTLGSREQQAANRALRDGLVRTQNGHGYAGPEAQVDAAVDINDVHAIATALAPFASLGSMQAAVVRHSSTRDGIEAVLSNGQSVHIPVSHMPAGAPKLLAATASKTIRLQRGAIIWVEKDYAGKSWNLTQRPQMEGALVSLDSKSGDIVALAGGFDFDRSKFNHVTQAERQPGSTFKPFVFSAALEKGLFPGTRIDDERRVVVPEGPGQAAWGPKNSPAQYDGFITEREGLAKSKNVIAVNVMEAAGAAYVHDYVARFGFDMTHGHEGLTLALGAKTVTPLELARGYSVFANGGKLVYPKIISRVSERDGQVLFDEKREDLQPVAVTSERNAFVVNSLLQSVVDEGSGHRAAALSRKDTAGKTGTSNEAKDAWFSGYSSGLTTVAWVGFDQPKSLGRVAGGTVALPIWLDFMKSAVTGRDPSASAVPFDLTKFSGDFVYPEYLEGRCIMPPDYVDTPFRCGTDLASWQPKEGHTENSKVASLTEQREQVLQLFSQ